ncbi:uncharacterized protein HKW66_Vig0219220 [Vigna angularis]|uniref:Uncharacterized protein n=2 Tax=Phaseolus angularis TaxID=3914 RepID=A0A8T0JG66_PHAAN|nr:uncharacterized protein HKW66_Vig0219220 [Vigna angularis]BAT92315.1 hypothetical protein VIGAN_07101100 [Vigna angularis var. angularis]
METMEASTKGREVQEFVERMVRRCNEIAKGRKRLGKEANKAHPRRTFGRRRRQKPTHAAICVTQHDVVHNPVKNSGGIVMVISLARSLSLTKFNKRSEE